MRILGDRTRSEQGLGMPRLALGACVERACLTDVASELLLLKWVRRQLVSRPAGVTVFVPGRNVPTTGAQVPVH